MYYIHFPPVLDDIPPEITCPDSYDLEISTPNVQTVAYTGKATATDNVGTPEITYDPPELTVSSEDTDKPPKIVKATATDADGNTAECKFMVGIKCR